jgi:hypothetical protein
MPNYNAAINGVNTQFKPQGALIEPLAEKPINTKHYISVEAVLRNRGDRQDLIRRYVLEGLQRDGLL